MKSGATTVEQYLAELPDDRRDAIETVRGVVLANLPEGIVEEMNWGMISYGVPLETYPDTYNGQPLMFAALASQKNYMSLYLMSVYSSPDGAASFHEAYEATGKRLDMGKSCVRFRKLDDLPLDLIAETISSITLEDFIETYKNARRR
ncbi:MAG: DUF1801 domain-containing protein [Actinomycetota bacterium]